jgi:hypothetical protein
VKSPMRAAVCFLCFVCLTRCGSNPLGPADLVNPELASLTVDPFATIWPEGGILAVDGRLADSTSQLRNDEAIAIQVIVASGDAEEMLLESAYHFPGPRFRTLIAVSMRAPHLVDELDGVVSQVPARWWLICPFRTCGAVRVFDSRRVDGAIQALRADGRVESADRDVVAFAGTPPPLGTVLFAAAPLDYGPALPGDGVVQGQKGDLIEVRYTQPDGSVLIDSIVMQ